MTRASERAPRSSRPGFSANRWLLAPVTTWRARRLLSRFSGVMDARTAWMLSRLASCPGEMPYAMRYRHDDA